MDLRGRRLVRNPRKSASDCRERLSRCIMDDDWECSSEDDTESEREQAREESHEEKSASTRSSVKRVASVVAKFDEKKREIVRSIGFGGILELAQINKIMYLETLKIHGITKPKDVYPRIKAYDCTYLRKLIEADMASSSSSSRNPTWGSTIVRRQPPAEKPKGPDEAILLEKLRGAGDFREELTEFGKENFSGKLNESHINAMIAYGERCTTHFNTLRTSLMKENLFLVEMLMPPSYNAPKETAVPSRSSYNSSGCAQPHGKADMRTLRGYELASEGLRSSSRTRYHGGAETLLTGFSLGSNFAREEDIVLPCGEGSNTIEVIGGNHGPNIVGTQETSASNAEAQGGCQMEKIQNDFVMPTGYADPPSFDLGIDFQTQEKYMAAVKEVAVNQGDGASASNTGFGTLAHTPPSGKRKSDAVKSSTSEQRLKTSTTSPASMSKILADGVVFARMMRTEEELDMNMKPWDHDTTDSPVAKQVVVNCRIPNSPWFYGLTHRNCPTDIAERIFHQVMSMGDAELARTWIIHRTPRYLNIPGAYIKKSFSLEEPFDYDLYDIAIRRIVQLDGTMYQNSKEKCWRHILESDFAVLA